MERTCLLNLRRDEERGVTGVGRERKLTLGECKASGGRGSRQKRFWEKANHVGF